MKIVESVQATPKSVSSDPSMPALSASQRYHSDAAWSFLHFLRDLATSAMKELGAQVTLLSTHDGKSTYTGSDGSGMAKHDIAMNLDETAFGTSPANERLGSAHDSIRHGSSSARVRPVSAGKSSAAVAGERAGQRADNLSPFLAFLSYMLCGSFEGSGIYLHQTADSSRSVSK